MPGRERLQLAVLLILGVSPYLLNGWYNPILATHQWAFWVVEIVTWIVLPSSLLFSGFRRRLFTPDDIGLSGTIRGRKLPLLIPPLAILITIALYFLDRWAVAFGKSEWPSNPLANGFSYLAMLPPPGPATRLLRLAALVHLSVTAGVVEEIYYRGVFMRLFGDGIAAGCAFVVISAIVFASVHWEGGVIVLFEALVWGVASAMVYRLVRNLWPLIVAHVVVDLLWLMGY